MENTEISYVMTVRNIREEWNEKLTGFNSPSPTDDNDAINQAREIIGFFNKTLRSGESKRQLTCVQRIETKVIDIMKYKSQTQNS